MEFHALTDEQRHDFETDGYLILKRVIDPQAVRRLIEAGDALIASDLQQGRQRTADGRYDSFRNVIGLLEPVLDLLSHGPTLSRVLQLMSPNLQLHTSHLIYKQPADAPETTRREPGWHRDINTLPHDLGPATPRMEIKVAFQLSDASRRGCGQTVVAPGSHRLTRPLEIGDAGDPAEVVEPLLEPGDAMLFENRTWHAGGFNHSGLARKTLMLGYSYRWMRPDDYLFQKPELLARCTPIQRQLLGDLGGLIARDGTFKPGGDERPLTDWCRQHGIDSAWQKEPTYAV